MTAATIIAAFAAGYLLGLYVRQGKPPLPDLSRRQRRW